MALEVLKKYAAADQEYVKIYEAILDRKDPAVLPDDHPIKGLKNYWEALSVEQTLLGLVIYHGRILVPRRHDRASWLNSIWTTVVLIVAFKKPGIITFGLT